MSGHICPQASSTPSNEEAFQGKVVGPGGLAHLASSYSRAYYSGKPKRVKMIKNAIKTEDNYQSLVLDLGLRGNPDTRLCTALAETTLTPTF